ncbi:hypothetical protein Lalb_Chr24g0401331 [Lupinus albus]|uniref:Uncharacterized protein n=1 Tax=Lupinus albus TaxID=3870 RepID=A0A6A4NGD3_LUPAL|nr:hypothetical protein Lalb_Chr24g0401331 [Lupinus albus]
MGVHWKSCVFAHKIVTVHQTMAIFANQEEFIRMGKNDVLSIGKNDEEGEGEGDYRKRE